MPPGMRAEKERQMNKLVRGTLEFKDLRLGTHFKFERGDPSKTWVRTSQAEATEVGCIKPQEINLIRAVYPVEMSPALTFEVLLLGAEFTWEGDPDSLWVKTGRLTAAHAPFEAKHPEVKVALWRRVGMVRGKVVEERVAETRRGPEESFVDGRLSALADVRAALLERATTLFLAGADDEARFARDLLLNLDNLLCGEES